MGYGGSVDAGNLWAIMLIVFIVIACFFQGWKKKVAVLCLWFSLSFVSFLVLPFPDIKETLCTFKVGSLNIRVGLHD